MIGQNSTYLFYVPENGKKLIITLIDSNVKKWRFCRKNLLKESNYVLLKGGSVI
jgi:hypothetical protein